MPIAIEDFATPYFIKYKTRYPLSEDKKDRFIKFEGVSRSYRGDGGSFPQPGYNPNHQSTTIEKINMESDEFTIKAR